MEEPAQADQSQMMSTVKITWVRHSMSNDTQSKGGKGRRELGDLGFMGNYDY